MSYIGTELVDLNLLRAYDAKIKAYINNGDLNAIKKVAKSTDDTKLLFFRDKDAVVGIDTPDFEIDFPTTGFNEDLSQLITEDKESVVGAINETYNRATEVYGAMTPYTTSEIDTVFNA